MLRRKTIKYSKRGEKEHENKKMIEYMQGFDEDSEVIGIEIGGKYARHFNK